VIDRQEFYARRCVAGLIHVVEQVAPRAADRGLASIDDATAGLLLLWSLLRWERTFAIRMLERLGIDLWSLACKVDEALASCGRRGGESGACAVAGDLDACLRTWLDRAAEQASVLRHGFLGIEHLLLAMLARRAAPFAALLDDSGLTYDGLKDAIIVALGHAVPPEILIKSAAAMQSPATAETSRWIAEIDRPAVGVPRRFGVFLLMLMVTLYAILFSFLRTLHASNTIFALLAVLFTGIGIGQAVLFGGRYPRAASIWIGAVMAPIEIIIYCCLENDFGRLSGSEFVAAAIVLVIAGIPLGAIFGYLFGTLTAGGFFLVDWYEKRQKR